VDGIGQGWRPDGELAYRGTAAGLVAILPRVCKQGIHDVAATGYTAREVRARASEVYLRIACEACRAANNPDYAWVLLTGGIRPSTAELDDGPYASLHEHAVFSQRPTSK
jgi:hypothetical protein